MPSRALGPAIFAAFVLLVTIVFACAACGAGSRDASSADDVVTIQAPTAAPSGSAIAIATTTELAPLPPPKPRVAPPRDLDGAIVRIVYTAAREADARTVQSRLEERGVKVIMAPTSDSGNEPHLGKLYVESKRYEDRIDQIVQLVADIEALTPEPDDLSDEVDFNLWVARPP